MEYVEDMVEKFCSSGWRGEENAGEDGLSCLYPAGGGGIQPPPTQHTPTPPYLQSMNVRYHILFILMQFYLQAFRDIFQNPRTSF